MFQAKVKFLEQNLKVFHRLLGLLLDIVRHKLTGLGIDADISGQVGNSIVDSSS